MKISVIIPAFNEEDSIAQVINSIPQNLVEQIVVVNNASTDSTETVAKQAGSTVIFEPQRGYGKACLTGIKACENTDVIVFLDADYSDDPSEMSKLLEPVLSNEADLVIGSRILGDREKGALPAHAQFGNILACFLIKKLFNQKFTDLGPFRAIRRKALVNLNMRDEDYGWTVEMQARAAILGLRCKEVPVSYKIRIGRSKISGTLHGSIKAGTKILWTIFKLWLTQNRIRNDVKKNES